MKVFERIIPAYIAPALDDERAITAEYIACLSWLVDYRMKGLRFAIWRWERAIERWQDIVERGSGAW